MSPLVPRELAWPAAGFLALAAGLHWASAESGARVLDQLGVKLPLLSQIAYGSPLLVVSGLLLAAGLVLASTRCAPPEAWCPNATRALRCSAWVGVALALLLGVGVLAAYPLPLTEVQRRLQK